jgi:pilus assembly protein FimV
MGISIATNNKHKALRLAEKHLAKGETRLATQIYVQVVEADPTDIVTMNSLGDLYVRAQQIAEATLLFIQIAEAYRVRGDNLKHIAMLKKVTRLAPTNVEVAMRLGDLYLQNGLRVEAREQFIRVANECLKAGQEQQAVATYQRIIDLDPANVALRLRLAELYERNEDTAQAHQHYLDAGCDLMHKDDLATALYACQKALDLRPDSNQALAAIARIYLQQGQSERALNLLQEACEKYSEDVEQLKLLGNTYLSLNRIEEAERTFQIVVERDPNNYYYLLAVGKIHLEAGAVERAVQQLALCLENLIAMGDENTAVDYLDKALERDPDNLTALKLLAQGRAQTD